MPTGPINLRSIKTPTLHLQIKVGRSALVPGEKRREITPPVYVEFDGGSGRVTERQILLTFPDLGPEEGRNRMLRMLRAHRAYKSGFEILPPDAESAGKEAPKHQTAKVA